MSESNETPVDLMGKEARDMMECVMFSAETARAIEEVLIAAVKGEWNSPDDVQRLITLSSAAHAIADGLPESYGLPVAWYRDMGQRMLMRACEAMTAVRASIETRETGARVHKRRTH